jgi:hypothetical protein
MKNAYSCPTVSTVRFAVRCLFPILMVFAAAIFVLAGLLDAADDGKGKTPRGGPPAQAVLQGTIPARSPLARGVGNHHWLSRFGDMGLGRLHEAVQTLGSTEAALFVDVDDTLGAVVTVPANVAVVHFGGARLDLNNFRITIEGPFTAGEAAIFSGSGDVEFASGTVSRVVPQWWGEKNSLNVGKALAAAASCGAELFLPAGDYVFTDTVEFRFDDVGFEARALTVRGCGPGRTVIDNRTAGEPAFRFCTENSLANWGWFLTLEGIDVTSATGTGGCGVEIVDIWMGRIADCSFHDQAEDGIRMCADVNDFGLPKTWIVENTLLVKNGRYGIYLKAVSNGGASYNVVLDRLDVELNAVGGICASAENMKILNSIIAYNGTDSLSKGGVAFLGEVGYRIYENVIAGNGFEGNFPCSVYADRVAELSIEGNDFARVLHGGGARPDRFIAIDGLNGGNDVSIARNQFGSGILNNPFTAIVGGSALVNVDLNNNRFNLQAGDVKYTVDGATKVTSRIGGDTVLHNQTIAFADSLTGVADTVIRRAGPGILSVTGGVVPSIQVLSAIGGTLSIDCSLGLTVLHTLYGNSTVTPPLNAVPGAVLRISVLQGTGTAFALSFDPVFKAAGPLAPQSLCFGTVQFVFSGMYWIQLGAAVTDLPL